MCSDMLSWWFNWHFVIYLLFQSAIAPREPRKYNNIYPKAINGIYIFVNVTQACEMEFFTTITTTTKNTIHMIYILYYGIFPMKCFPPQIALFDAVYFKIIQSSIKMHCNVFVSGCGWGATVYQLWANIRYI